MPPSKVDAPMMSMPLPRLPPAGSGGGGPQGQIEFTCDDDDDGRAAWKSIQRQGGRQGRTAAPAAAAAWAWVDGGVIYTALWGWGKCLAGGIRFRQLQHVVACLIHDDNVHQHPEKL